jgi:hypothetical protein
VSEQRIEPAKSVEPTNNATSDEVAATTNTKNATSSTLAKEPKPPQLLKHWTQVGKSSDHWKKYQVRSEPIIIEHAATHVQYSKLIAVSHKLWKAKEGA